MQKLILACMLLLATLHGKAQWPRQVELSRQMYLHTMAHPASVLYVHFDKNIYSNNETVWFTGYLLRADPKESALHHLMSVALVRDVDSMVIKQEKYLMDAGVGYGCMLLPDSMITGSYHFVATTNLVRRDEPDVMFTQPITIKTNIDPRFMAGITLLKPAANGQPNTVRINVTDKDDHPLKQPVFVSYKYGSLQKTEKADAAGQVELSIPEELWVKDPNLYTRIRSGNDSTFMNFMLPVTKRRATVNFYPEGGYMVDNLPCRVAFEVKDQQGASVATKAVFYADNYIIDTIETSSTGIGSYMVSPFPGAKYTLRLLHDGFVDSAYVLPASLSTGVAVFLAEAAVKDTLQVRILTSKLGRVGVRIHDFRDTYFYDELELDAPNKTFKIPLGPLPRGLKAFTVSDSLGRPLSERIFFAKYDTTKRMHVSTDKTVYGRREKVTMHLKMTAGDTLGMASIACVQDNRLSARQKTDIESYLYLNSELSALPISPIGRGIDEKKYVEDVMLVKGWRKYNWLDIFKTTARDTARVYDSVDVRIRISKFGKAVKKPMQIGLLRDRGFGMAVTNAEGIASLNDSALIIEPGKKVHVVVIDKRQQDCDIETDDPYVWLNRHYATMLPDDYNIIPSSVKNNRELALKGNEKVRQLKEVVIKAKDDKNFYFRGNECGDYVCQFNILNCPNHRDAFGNHAPVEGHTYTDGFSRMQIVYRGCKDKDQFIVSVPAIYTRKEFYVDKYAEPLEPAFISTLYWNHGIILDKNEQTLEFYTGDITGTFRIIVQGVTSSDVATTECTFEVQGAP